MAVTLNTSNDRNNGASQTVQLPGDLTDGLAVWAGTSRDTNEDYSGEASSINSVSASSLSSDFGTVGTSRIHIDIPWWIEANFPTTGTTSYTTTNTLDNQFQGSYCEFEGVDQADPFDESEEKEELITSSAVPTALAPVVPSGGAVLYIGVTTGTHDASLNDGFTLLRNFVPFSGVECSIGYKLYPSGGTAAVRATSSSVLGFHRAFVINPESGGGGGGFQAAWAKLSNQVLN